MNKKRKEQTGRVLVFLVGQGDKYVSVLIYYLLFSFSEATYFSSIVQVYGTSFVLQLHSAQSILSAPSFTFRCSAVLLVHIGLL